MRSRGWFLIALMLAVPVLAGQYAQDFSAFAPGATNFADGSQLFSSAPTNIAGVVDATYRELLLTDVAIANTRSAFLLPDLDPGTNIYAFSAKWNAVIFAPFPNGADGMSVTFGQVRGLDLIDGYPQEFGYGTGITFSVQTYSGGSPGLYIRVNGAVVAAITNSALAQWGSYNPTRHYFEADWNVLTGLSVSMDGSNLFSGVSTTGFVSQAGDSVVFAARSGSVTESCRIDNILVMTGGNLTRVPMTAPFYKSGEHTNANQTADKAFDGTNLTKWLTFSNAGFVGATCGGGARNIHAYTLMSAEDFPTRDPKTWTLEGSSDGGSNWTVCADAAGAFVTRNEQRAWAATNASAFGAYRLNISSNFGAAELQLAELKLYEFKPQTFAGVPTLPFVQYGDAEWGDFDNDGLLDVAVAGTEAQPGQVWRNNGSGIFSFAFTLPVSLSFSGGIKWGDYNNDGYLDLVAVGAPDAALIRNEGGTNLVKVPLAGLSQVANSSVAWVDYDNDGRLDFSVVGDFNFTLWHNDGGNSFTPFQVPGLEIPRNVGPPSGGGYELYPADTKDMAWLDYDGDGRKDFVYGGGNVFQLWRNDGSGGFSQVTNSGLPVIAQPGFYCYGLSITTGDMNADGHPDVIFANDNWRRVYLNDGAGNFTYNFVPVWDPTPYYTYQTAEIADVNGDGHLDLTGHSFDRLSWILNPGAGLGPNSRQFVLLADGAGGYSNFSPVSYYVPYSPNHVSMAWADADRDGRQDLLMTSAASLAWRNLTGASNSPPAAPAGLAASVTGQTAVLSWAAGTDATTPSTGLTYNVRIGSGPGLANVLNPSAAAAGLRRLSGQGNAGSKRALFINLPPGTYYWSVQSVDNSWAGSAFAGEASFAVSPYPPILVTNLVRSVKPRGADIVSLVNAGTAATVGCQYGTTTNYGGLATLQTVTNSASTTVTFKLRTLDAMTVYHARTFVTNALGVSYGSDLVFTTLVDNSGMDIVLPTDPQIPQAGGYGGGQEVNKAIDNLVSSRMLYFGLTDAGYVVTPSGNSPVRAVVVYGWADPSRDPGGVRLEGSMDGVTFTLLGASEIPPYPDAYGLFELPIENNTAYDYYRVLITHAQNPLDVIDTGDIELLAYPGLTSPGDGVTLTLPPGASNTTPVATLFDKQFYGGDKKFMVANVTNAVTVDVVPVSGPSILKGFEMIGAHDDYSFPQRRPSSIMVSGSSDGTNFTPIVSGSPVAPSGVMLIQEFKALTNTLAFTRYRVTFGQPAGGNFLQVGELRLLGDSLGSTMDAWRYQHFGVTGNADAAADDADPDEDGSRNLMEFFGGTSPTNFSDSPLFNIDATGGAARVYYRRDTNAAGTVSWTIESATNLAGGWSVRAGSTNTVATNAAIRTMRFDPAPPTLLREFYRLKVTRP